MLLEKKKILIHRLIWLAIAVVGGVVIFMVINSVSLTQQAIYLTVVYEMLVSLFLIASFTLSYKVYRYEGKLLIVYAGWFHHYIKIDGTKFDEHDTLISYTPIILSCELDNGTFVQATISTFNRISLKVNGRLFTKEIS